MSRQDAADIIVGEEGNVPELRKEFLNMVPTYEGQPETLNRFVTSCDRLISRFYDRNNPDNFQNEYLLDCLLSKIQGAASTIVFSHPHETWDQVRKSLLDNFGDRRDSLTLTQEMCSLKQMQSEDAYKFYERVNKVLNSTISKIQCDSEDAQACEITVNYLRKLGLRCLLKGLNEPLGSFMRTKAPETMAEAARILINDYNLIPSFRKQEKQNQNRGVPATHTNKPQQTRPNSNTRGQFAGQRSQYGNPYNRDQNAGPSGQAGPTGVKIKKEQDARSGQSSKPLNLSKQKGTSGKNAAMNLLEAELEELEINPPEEACEEEEDDENEDPFLGIHGESSHSD